MKSDTDIMLYALQKERDELHSRIMQIDRIMSRLKAIEYSPAIVDNTQTSNEVASIEMNSRDNFPKTADIKLQVLRVFEILGKASQRVLLDEYKPEGFDLFYQPSNVIYE